MGDMGNPSKIGARGEGPSRIGVRGEGPSKIGARSQGEHHSTDPRTAENAEMSPGKPKSRKSSTYSRMLFSAARLSEFNNFLCNGFICSESMKLHYLITRENV